jgi:hypothetical protein
VRIPQTLAGLGVPAAAVLLLAVGGPAHASEQEPEPEPGPRCGTVDQETGDIVLCSESEADGVPEGSTEQVGERWTPPDDWVLSEWYSGGTEEDGTPCIEHHRQWMHEDDHADQLYTRNYSFFRWYEIQTWDGDTVEPCEDQPDDPGVPPQLVLEVVESRLPLPEPQVQPGWALTGMPSYLEVGAPATFSDEVSGGQLPVTFTFEGTATYRVDWGDGHVSEHASSGGPYPDGDIVYTYADAVDRTVVVTPIWSVTARGAGQTFEFPDVELVSSEVELPVRELQSVRIDGGR